MSNITIFMSHVIYGNQKTAGNSKSRVVREMKQLDIAKAQAIIMFNVHEIDKAIQLLSSNECLDEGIESRIQD